MALVDAMISTLIQKLSTVLKAQRQNYQSDFENEFQVMKGRLRNIESVLGDVDGRNEQSFQEIFTQFRDLMYEADDLLTDCLVAQQHSKNGHLSNLFRPNKFLFRLQTGKKLQDINARLKEFDNTFGKHLKKRVEGPSAEEDYIEQQMNIQNPISVSDDDHNDTIGLESDVKKIKDWIFAPNSKLQKVGIVGMGGLGKTTLAMKIFNDSFVYKHFEKRIWVSISQSFSGEKILRSILQQLGAELVDQQLEDINQMLQKIILLLRRNTCLIILDDLWETGLKFWMGFFSALPENDCAGSRFIITTRNIDVAHAIQVDNIHQPNVLNESESWLLFSKHAFVGMGEDKSMIENFEQVGKKIVAQCDGHPLAIKTIGALLASKLGSLDEWESICDNFSISNIPQENVAVMTSLRLSYEALPTHLKQCLLSFSIYPEDFEIPAKELVYWWIGEGFILGANKSKTVIELGFEHLSQLISRCLVEVVKRRGFDGRVYICKMHDLVRDLTLMMANEEKVCCFDIEGKQKLDKETRWLGVAGEKNGNSLNKSPNLRALFVMTSDKAPLNHGLGSLLSLRALDVSNNKLDNAALKNLLTWITSLKRLAYLNISGAKGLQEIPDTICKLRNLQLLVLTGCPELYKISPLVTQLKRLLVLDLSYCDKLRYLPRGIGRLVQLEQLSGLRLAPQANKSSCQLVEIEELVELRVLQLNLSYDSEITEKERDVLSKLKKLEVLAIDFDSEIQEWERIVEMLDHISPPEGLKELYLRGYYHETMPRWFRPENFPNLAYLCIEEAHLVQICANDSNSSWNLEGLRLRLLPYLKMDWNNLRKEMPLLCYAEVSGCYQIVNFPSSTDKPGTCIWRRN
ncbi:hypothetical protein JCGZ_16251 [Jatropha curcas]|uniref:Uncharacterized protein n=2 Tax=Jatropha curcas TaxID=180498 RepID=A0A067K6D7_JATCU|nr:hypothetical protein JCGZ_16251 [Jatropha curcas]